MYCVIEEPAIDLLNKWKKFEFHTYLSLTLVHVNMHVLSSKCRGAVVD